MPSAQSCNGAPCSRPGWHVKLAICVLSVRAAVLYLGIKLPLRPDFQVSVLLLEGALSIVLSLPALLQWLNLLLLGLECLICSIEVVPGLLDIVFCVVPLHLHICTGA